MTAESYPEHIQKLLLNDYLMPLDDGEEHSDFRTKLEDPALSNYLLSGSDRVMGNACLSGLWLYHNFLNTSHEISQEIDTPEGSYWHAIMHRREGDYWNSKYWIRQCGSFSLASAMKEKLKEEDFRPAGPDLQKVTERWDPQRFVDVCERIVSEGGNDHEAAQRIQMLEWESLFRHCLKKAGL